MSQSSVRQRSSKIPTTTPTNPTKAPDELEDNSSRVISPFDILRVFLTVLGAALVLSYYLTSGSSLLYGYNPWFMNPAAVARYFQGPLHLTPTELATFDGQNSSKPIYLAINGTIFDVSAGRHTYGPGGGYSVFAGRDATRAFVTGCFLEDRTGDLRGAEEIYLPVEDAEEEKLSSGERKKRAERERREAKKKVLQEVRKWEDFYGKNEKYFEVGKVIVVEEYTGPAPTLCEIAQKGRPKRTKMNEAKAKGPSAPGKPVQ